MFQHQKQSGTSEHLLYDCLHTHASDSGLDFIEYKMFCTNMMLQCHLKWIKNDVHNLKLPAVLYIYKQL